VSTDILSQLGEFEEFGDRAPRVILPESHYPVEITLNEVGLTKVRDTALVPALVDENGNQLEDVVGGGVPYLDLAVKVVDGPFGEVEGAGFSFRQSCTPGKGGYIGFVAGATRAVTGQAPDAAAITKYKFQFPNGADDKQAQQLFRTQFFLLDPEERKDFMTIFTRARLWNGRKAIVRVSHDLVERTNDITGETYTATYHRVEGYFALNHPKKGLAWVKSACYPEQAAALEEILAGQVV